MTKLPRQSLKSDYGLARDDASAVLWPHQGACRDRPGHVLASFVKERLAMAPRCGCAVAVMLASVRSADPDDPFPDFGFDPTSR